MSSTTDSLFPVTDFNLIGIATRYPQNHAKLENLSEIKKGVFSLKRGEHDITLIVSSKVANEKRNAIWQMFSGDPEQIIEGLEAYDWKRNDYKHIVSGQLIQKYKSEGVVMAYTEQDFFRESLNYCLSKASVEDILKHIKPEDVFKNYKPEDVF